MTSSVVYSCVAGSSPRYQYGAVVWAHTLVHLAQRAPEELVVHSFQPSGALLRLLPALGVEVIELSAEQEEHSPLDKLAQLRSVRLADAAQVVLCDCDLAFAADISAWVGGDVVRAKMVDLSIPPFDIWRRVLWEAGFRQPIAKRWATHQRARTYANNFNGGLYVLPHAAFVALRDVWPRWISWLRDRAHLLGRWAVHGDQVSFGLALAELELPAEPLPAELNFPTHLRSRWWSPEPRALHYHTRLGPTGLLLPVRSPAGNRAIARVNAQIASSRLDACYRELVHSVR